MDGQLQTLPFLCAPSQVDAFGPAIEVVLCGERTKDRKQTYTCTCIVIKEIVAYPRVYLLSRRQSDRLIQRGLPFSKRRRLEMVVVFRTITGWSGAHA